MSTSTLFDAPLGYSGESLSRWIDALNRVWMAFAGRPSGDLEEDLASLAPAFATGTSPKTLRTLVSELPPIDDDDLSFLPDSIALRLHRARLITPEGRILLAVLAGLERDGDAVVSGEKHIEALTRSLRTRADWHAAWLRKQLTGTLSPPVVGAALFLLINGSIGVDAALVLPKEVARDKALGRVVLPMIGIFSMALGGQEPDPSSGLRSHWTFTQVSRFLSRDVVRARQGSGAVMYVRIGHEQHMMQELQRRLTRHSPAKVEVALDSFVTKYRESRGKLISLGTMHEDPTHTRRIVRALTASGPLP